MARQEANRLRSSAALNSLHTQTQAQRRPSQQQFHVLTNGQDLLTGTARPASTRLGMENSASALDLLEDCFSSIYTARSSTATTNRHSGATSTAARAAAEAAAKERAEMRRRRHEQEKDADDLDMAQREAARRRALEEARVLEDAQQKEAEDRERVPAAFRRNEAATRFELAQSHRDDETAIAAARKFVAEVREAVVSGAYEPQERRERLADQLTDMYMCQELDPLKPSKVVTRVRKTLAAHIEAFVEHNPQLYAPMLSELEVMIEGKRFGESDKDDRPEVLKRRDNALEGSKPKRLMMAAAVSQLDSPPQAAGADSGSEGTEVLEKARESHAAAKRPSRVPQVRLSPPRAAPENRENHASVAPEVCAEEDLSAKHENDIWQCSVCGRTNSWEAATCAICGRTHDHLDKTRKQKRDEIEKSKKQLRREFERYLHDQEKRKQDMQAYSAMGSEIRQLLGVVRSLKPGEDEDAAAAMRSGVQHENANDVSIAELPDNSYGRRSESEALEAPASAGEQV